MITEKIIIIRDLDNRRVELFSNYSAYQEWLMDRANPIKKPFLALKFSIERSKEAKLEKKYGLPQFILRGTLYYLSYETVRDILAKAAAQQYNLATVVKLIQELASRHPCQEPYPIKLPIKATIDKGDELGSVYKFGDYNSYFNWKLGQSSFRKRLKLIKADLKSRKAELILEVHFNRPANYFRGIFDIDYQRIIPEYGSRFDSRREKSHITEVTCEHSKSVPKRLAIASSRSSHR